MWSLRTTIYSSGIWSREYLQEQNGIDVVGTAGDGVETLRLVTECEAGCSGLRLDYAADGRLRRSGTASGDETIKQPGVIALTALGRDDFISRAVNLGVNYYMVKPFDFMMLAQRVYEAAGESLRAEAISAKMIKQQGGKTGGETLEERIANLFLTVGIPAHIKGYQYLREAVRMVMDNPELMGRITKGALSRHCPPLRHDVQQGGTRDSPCHRGGVEPRAYRRAGRGLRQERLRAGR